MEGERRKGRWGGRGREGERGRGRRRGGQGRGEGGGHLGNAMNLEVELVS